MKGLLKARESLTGNFEESYRKSLENYLAKHNEEALRAAYELGRSALAEGIGIIEIATSHYATVRKVHRGARTPVSQEQYLERAEAFFEECLSPYEMSHRGFRDAISALRQLNETLENEIKRIAHAVHDEAGQLVVAAQLAVSGLAHDLPPSLKARLGEVGAILDQAERQLRRISHELRPTILDDLGLAAALQFLAASISKRSNLSVSVESHVDNRQAPSVETAVYRIVQEALANITRHSAAKNVKIALRRNATGFHCLVHDDGVGFDVAAVLSRRGQKGLGLLGIRERLNAIGGTIEIYSAPGQGTELSIKIPLEKQHANSSDSGR